MTHKLIKQLVSLEAHICQWGHSEFAMFWWALVGCMFRIEGAEIYVRLHVKLDVSSDTGKSSNTTVASARIIPGSGGCGFLLPALISLHSYNTTFLSANC